MGRRAIQDGIEDMAFLELNGICKSHGTGASRTEVLHGIDLEIERGELVAIAGISGAGKTTLISLIAGLLRPDSGTIILDGKEVTGPGPDRGVVFQNYSLLPWLTVRGNIDLAVDQVFAGWTRSRRREQTEKYMDLVRLTPAAGKLPSELSGGMRQRVALARALAAEPALLLCDEPLGALDALTRAVLQEEIDRIRAEDGRTMILVTNDVDEAILLADRILPLTGGPAATLGPAIPVDIPRPRSRKTLHHQSRWKELRREVIEILLGSRGRRALKPAHAPRALHVPQLEAACVDGPDGAAWGKVKAAS